MHYPREFVKYYDKNSLPISATERDSSLCIIDFDNGTASEIHLKIIITGEIEGSGKTFSYIDDFLAIISIERFILESVV